MKWSKLPTIYKELILSLDKKQQQEIELTWIGEENVFNFEKTKEGKEFWQSVFAAKSISEMPGLVTLKKDDYDKLLFESKRLELFKSKNNSLYKSIENLRQEVQSLNNDVKTLQKKLYKKEIELIASNQSSLDFVKTINQAHTRNAKDFLAYNYIITKTDQISKDIEEACNAKFTDDLPF